MSGSQYCIEPTYTNHRLAIYLKFKGNGHLEISVAKPGKPTQGYREQHGRLPGLRQGPGGSDDLDPGCGVETDLPLLLRGRGGGRGCVTTVLHGVACASRNHLKTSLLGK